MGQSIQVEATTVGDVVILDTDRSITGQDGAAYASSEEAAASDRFPAQLALRLFTADAAVNHVFVASNQVVVRRDGAWEGASVDAVSDVVANFFLFYPEGIAG